MSPAWSPCARAAVLGALILGSGCKSGANAAPPPASDSGGAPAALTFSFDTSLACASGGLCAPPSQVVQLDVASSDGRPIDVALAGDYADAALTASSVTVVSGHALLALETSSTPTTFSVVARPSSDPSAPATVLPVAVGASGFARVLALPSYAGNRSASAFLATAVVLSTCAELDGTSEGDAGTPTGPTQPWLSGPSGAPIVLTVPADERFAIEVRVGHYVAGCADVPPLAATTTSTIAVTAYDVPMALSQTDMNVTFDFAPTSAQAAAWQAAMSLAGEDVADGFFASESDGAALLDAMEALVPANEQASFEQSRTTGGWDTTADGWLSARAPSMHDRAAAWLTDAANDVPGPLVLHLGQGSDDNTDPVTATSYGVLTAALAGVTVPHVFNWTADADDTVHLAGAISLATITYIGDEAGTHAASTVAGSSDVPSAIALEVDCAGLAAGLVGAGDAYAGCAASCTASWCTQAIAATWTAATTSSGTGDTILISLTLGAPADVGDDAEPVFFQSGWLGQVSQVNGPLVPAPFAIEGTVTGLEVTSP